VVPNRKAKSKTPKVRLDALLVQRGLAENRTRAQALVMAGVVYSGERRLDKTGQTVAADTPLTVRGAVHPWVSRGGVKLDYALTHFGIDVSGCIALDIGASTGGFTDVLLARGAARVYAVDVGQGQLAWELRNDPRVVVLENINARNLTAAEVPEAPGVISCDASFIGLETVLPAVLALSRPDCVLIALIKPQFEVGPENVGKGGVVRDARLHAEVCERISRWLAARPGWRVLGVSESPLTGPKGNKEFLIAARREGKSRAGGIAGDDDLRTM
jgi:23S rRNA (cytidine1920-2'-O)/16S rRNA (cytidine1409-2'-O)-methyltransferase